MIANVLKKKVITFRYPDILLHAGIHCAIEHTKSPLCASKKVACSTMCLCLRLTCPLSGALKRGLLHCLKLSLINIWTSPSPPQHQKQVRDEEAKSPPVSWKTSNCFIKCQRTHNICLISSAGACMGFEVPCVAGAPCVSLRQLHRQTETGTSLLLLCTLTALIE